MTEQTFRIDTGKETIRDLDADERGNFIAITDAQRVVANYDSLTLGAAFRFPLIRRLDADTFFIADCRTSGAPNGHVFGFDGRQIASFFIGDGVEDVVVHRGKIVVTYFDEGVLGDDDGPNKDGLAVFDFSGKQLFGFNSAAIHGYMIDCYCICRHGVNRVLFYACPDFQVLELNLDTFGMERYDTPDDFEGACAISGMADRIVLHRSYKDQNSFFVWSPQKGEVTKFGDCPSRLRGLGNGKFLRQDDTGYSIIHTLDFIEFLSKIG